MNFQMALNTVTIKPTQFIEKIRLISKVGFSGIGLWMDEIQDYLKKGPNKLIKELMEDYALAPVEMQTLLGWQYLTGSDQNQAFSEAKDFLTSVKQLDIHCPVVALPSVEIGEIKNAIKDFRRLCNLANDFGINLAFEFVAYAKQINNVKIAWEIVGEADCPNGGLLIDTFHFMKGGSKIEDLKHVPMEKVFLVHISDVRPLPLTIREQSRRFRFLPGEGEAPLKEIVQCFVENGYKGFYCCETFNEEYWLQDPLTILERSKKSMENLFLSVVQ